MPSFKRSGLGAPGCPRATIISSFSRACPFSFFLAARRWKKARVFYNSERTKVFTLCQQAVSSPASRGRKREIGKERTEAMGEKVIGAGACRAAVGGG